MRKGRRALCAAMAVAMLLSVSCAEEETLTEATAAPTAAPSAPPEPAGTVDPAGTPVPTVTAAPTGTPESTEAADATGTPAPMETPGSTDVPEPTETVGETSTPAPMETPGLTNPPESTDAPTSAPLPTDIPTQAPDPSKAIPVIRVEGDAVQKDGTWQIGCSAPEEKIAFVWTFDGEAARYVAEIIDNQGNAFPLEDPEEMRLEINAAEWLQGPCTLCVGAVLLDETIAWGSIDFAVVQQQQNGRPGGGFNGGGFGGARPGGGFSGGSGRSAGGSAGAVGGAPGSGMPEEAGFRVTPGEALTDDHASGTKNMTLYGTVALEVEETPMQALTVGGVALDVTLDGGLQPFTASIEDGCLILTPETEGEQWQLSGGALKTLFSSGIEALILVVDDSKIALETGTALGGAVYGKLCAAGYVSKDYLWQVDARGMEITVGEARYRLNASGELEPLGG